MDNNNLYTAQVEKKLCHGNTFALWPCVLLSIGGVLFTNVAVAQCKLDAGSQDTVIRSAVRYNPTQSNSSFDFSCSENTSISAVSEQPGSWWEFASNISWNQRDNNGINLPISNINAKFRARLTRVDSGQVLKEWLFNMTQPKIIVAGDSAAYQLVKGVKYRITTDSKNGHITPHTNVFKPLSSYRAMGVYLNIAGLFPTARGETEVTPITPPTCTVNAFTVTVPSTVDFNSIDINSLKAGQVFKKNFSITVERKSNQTCKPTTIPSVTFSTANTVIEGKYAQIPERGLLLSIYQERINTVLNFGKPSDLATQSGTKSVTEIYEGRIEKDSSATVTPGAFSITVIWNMSYR